MELRAGLGDRRALSAALNNMALLEMDDGDLAAARELFEQALAIKRKLGERLSLAIGLVNLGDLLTRIASGTPRPGPSPRRRRWPRTSATPS